MDGPAPLTAKGEKTRLRILRAAQQAIAELGVGAVSHRAIADRAGVRLSLTSYYFGSLDQMIEAAWDDQRARGSSVGREMRLAGEAIVAQMESIGRDPAARARLVRALAGTYATYIRRATEEVPEEAAFDAAFMFAWQLPERVREKVAAHTLLWEQRAADALRVMGSPFPESDAATLAGTIRYHEFASITYGRFHVDVAALEQRFFRLLRGMLPDVGEWPGD